MKKLVVLALAGIAGYFIWQSKQNPPHASVWDQATDKVDSFK